MVQTLNIMSSDGAKIIESTDIKEIKNALNKILYVSDIRLKPRIIDELTNYLNLKILNENYKIKIFIAYDNSEINGIVISQIDPEFKSYSRKCGTFGWLYAKNYSICKALIDSCERFIKSNRVRKIRGNFNFPKGIGGIGIQVKGFEEQMMFGVAFNDPNSKITDYLKNMGYIAESEYTCVRVEEATWKKGKRIDKKIKLGYLSLEELTERKDDIMNLAKDTFHVILPDASGGENRFNEMIKTYAQVPKSHYKLREDFIPEKYSQIPEFIEAWESCDLENAITWAPMAFDRKSGELVGLILSLPDLYELWLDKPITRNNVDTVMVKKEYSRRGIFSALNNIGQLTCNLNGITYYEGTSIWSNNKKAIDTIFPHCVPIRKHYVFQKRL